MSSDENALSSFSHGSKTFVFTSLSLILGSLTRAAPLSVLETSSSGSQALQQVNRRPCQHPRAYSILPPRFCGCVVLMRIDAAVVQYRPGRSKGGLKADPTVGTSYAQRGLQSRLPYFLETSPTPTTSLEAGDDDLPVTHKSLLRLPESCTTGTQSEYQTRTCEPIRLSIQGVRRDPVDR